MIWPETIRTDRLVLRRPVDADATAIFEGYAQDPEVVRYLMWRPHSSIEDTRTYLGIVQAGWDSATEYTWANRGIHRAMLACAGREGTIVAMTPIARLLNDPQVVRVERRENRQTASV